MGLNIELLNELKELEKNQLTQPEDILNFVKETALTLGLTPKNVLILDPNEDNFEMDDRLKAYQQSLGEHVPLNLECKSESDKRNKASRIGFSNINSETFRLAQKIGVDVFFDELPSAFPLDTITQGIDSTLLVVHNDFADRATRLTSQINQGKPFSPLLPLQEEKNDSLASGFLTFLKPSPALSVDDVTKFIFRHEVTHAATSQADVLSEHHIHPTGLAAKFLQSPYVALQKPSNQDEQNPSERPMNPGASKLERYFIDNHWREMVADGVATLLSLQDGMSPNALRKISISRQNTAHDFEHDSSALMDRLLDKYEQKGLQGKSGQEIMQIVAKELRQVWLEPNFYEALKKNADQYRDIHEQKTSAAPSKSSPVDHHNLWQASIIHGNTTHVHSNSESNQTTSRAA